VKILAIDPGASGGFAITDGTETYCYPMPEGMTEQADAIRSLLVGNQGMQCVMERVGTYVKGNSGPAAATFARHCGHLEAILYCLGIPTVQVAPQTWMKSLGTLPKEKPERKKAIKEAMARKYPTLKVTLKTADALGLLEYAHKTLSVCRDADGVL